MERNTEKIIQKLESKNIPVYSFSRLECINNCLYEAYRSYILDDRENAINNIYGVLGGRIHDVLEAMMNEKASQNDLLPAMNQELEDMDMLGIEFPKGRDGSDSIRQGWIADMTHFCNTYRNPKGTFETETFFLYESPNKHYVQGYIDLTKIHKDGSISIYDYKTSSMYRGDDIKKHGRQLVLYAMGKEQQGFKVHEIGWIFLKYCEISYFGKKTSRSKEETEIKKVIERKNIVRDLREDIENKLIKLGMDELDVECKLLDALNNNHIPEEVENEFVIKPYLLKYELTDEIRKECQEYIDTTIEKWENLNHNDVNQFSPLPFTKKNKKGEEKQNTFYCNSLCGYSKICPHLKKFYDTWDNKNEDDDLF